MNEPLQLENATVRRVLADIGGQGGSIALVPARLVSLGLPSEFVASVTRMDSVAKIQSTADMMAGILPESHGAPTVWSLELTGGDRRALRVVNREGALRPQQERLCPVGAHPGAPGRLTSLRHFG